MKASRQNAILNLIDSFEIGTQEELCERLLSEGFNVTQATVSRDIRELKLTKVVGTNGKQRYAKIFGEKQEKTPVTSGSTIIKEAILNVDTAKNMVVVKARAGMAPAVGSAVDAMKIPEMVGSIAGDDTLLCIMRNDDNALSMMRRLEKLRHQ